MLRTEGWKIYKKIIEEDIKDLRLQATQQKVGLEDRLWFSAQALGKEDSLSIPEIDYVSPQKEEEES